MDANISLWRLTVNERYGDQVASRSYYFDPANGDVLEGIIDRLQKTRLIRLEQIGLQRVKVAPAD